MEEEIEESWSSPFRCSNWFWTKCNQWVWCASSTCQKCLDEGNYETPERPWQDRMSPGWWEVNKRYGDANKWWERRGIDPSRFGYSAETGIERIRRYLIMRGVYRVGGYGQESREESEVVEQSGAVEKPAKKSEVVEQSGVVEKPVKMSVGAGKSTGLKKSREVISGGVQKSVGVKKGVKKDEKIEKGFGLAIKDLLQ